MKQTDIYKKLKALRKERGLTLVDLADKIGSDYQQLSRIERGKSRLTVDVLMKMADAFQTPIDQLINPKEETSPRESPHNSNFTAELREEKLSEAIEKLEALLQEAQTNVSPQAKASLTSLIYKEALENPRAIDFAMNVVRTLLTSKTP